jgi:hypothetical protein
MRIALVSVFVLMTACEGSKTPAVQDLVNGENLGLFKLGSLRGTRDGDHFQAQAMFTDSSTMLTLDMRFAVGSPTTLESGSWKWTRNNRLMTGTVAARSVTFLGGQDGPPSIGGAFDLLGPDGVAKYRVTIPLSELKKRLLADPSSTGHL